MPQRMKERRRERDVRDIESEIERERNRERERVKGRRQRGREDSLGNLPNQEIKRKERLITKIMTRNYEEKLSAEIITRNYHRKLSGENITRRDVISQYVICRGKFGNYRDTSVSKNVTL